MPDPIRLVGGKLLCDACGYCDDQAGAPTADMIGRPCPTCGANLLTEGDYIRAKALIAGFIALGETLEPVDPAQSKTTHIAINPHGDLVTITVDGGRE